MCINFANEKVREFSTNRLVKEELEWYEAENLDIPKIEFLDNRNVIGMDKIKLYLNSFCQYIHNTAQYTMHCNTHNYYIIIIDLLEHKTKGIFTLLEDESKQRAPKSVNFMKTLLNVCSQNPSFGFPKLERNNLETLNHCFIVRHFSQNVCYTSVNISKVFKQEEPMH